MKRKGCTCMKEIGGDMKRVYINGDKNKGRRDRKGNRGTGYTAQRQTRRTCRLQTDSHTRTQRERRHPGEGVTKEAEHSPRLSGCARLRVRLR